MKARHPEFEMFQGSVHQAAGLSCADCHMPYIKEGNTKISSHWLTSPMRTFQQSCGTCHKQSEKEMQERVLYIQDRVRDAENKAGAAVTDAINAIEAAKKAGASDQDLAEAREMHRRGQYYLDLLRQAQIKANQIVAGKK